MLWPVCAELVRIVPVSLRPVPTRWFSILLAVALAGCADLAVPWQQAAVPVPPPKPKRIHGALPVPASKPAPAADIALFPDPPPFALAAPRTPLPQAPPRPDPRRTVGLDADAVEDLLGPPFARRQQGASEVWTYGTGPCRTELYLYPNVATGTYTALAYREPEPAAGCGGEAAEAVP